MAILITGGCGYIGSHTCIEMLNAGYDIVVIDNYYNSKAEALRRVNGWARDLGPPDKALAAERRTKAVEYLKKSYELKPEQVSSAYFYAKVLHEDGDDEQACKIVNDIIKIPFSAILQIGKEEVEALQKEIG